MKCELFFVDKVRPRLCEKIWNLFKKKSWNFKNSEILSAERLWDLWNIAFSNSLTFKKVQYFFALHRRLCEKCMKVTCLVMVWKIIASVQFETLLASRTFDYAIIFVTNRVIIIDPFVFTRKSKMGYSNIHHHERLQIVMVPIASIGS